MPGRIRDEDVELVRSRIDFVEVVREHLALRGAGAGSYKGLCPFHDEKTPSFHVRAATGHYTCFGCGESGGVFDFVMKMDALTFPEAVERLAAKAGVDLRYEEGGVTPRMQQGQRSRLVQAHQAAAQFYQEQLRTPAAAAGREFLTQRGFDEQACSTFGVGFAPGTWEALVNHLRSKRFGAEELVTAGLAKQTPRGLRDRFVGRLVWPIADLSGEVVGFGARKLDEADPGPKYLNTPETPLYRKSTLLYGADLAKREIARRQQIVIVEGYTDVMACHLAGVGTAVATCGTAFGDDHVKVARRLLADQSEFRGEVIFTFDGDAAGQRAAVKAFALDHYFLTQTFVAVSADGLDPCEVRLQHGDAAVRELIATRTPLFEFAIRDALSHHNLDTAEGQVGALREAAPMVAGIRMDDLRTEYVRRLAGWLGIEDVTTVTAAVRRANRVTASGAAPARHPEAAEDELDPSTVDVAAAGVEREVLRVALQLPHLLGAALAGLQPPLFTVPAYAAVAAAVVAAATDPAAWADPQQWVYRVRQAAADDQVRTRVARLAVEPSTGPAQEHYAAAVLARLHEMALTRQIVQLKSKLQRMNPVTTPEHRSLFAEVITLEQRRRDLRELAFG
jgi:DNA primase